MPLIIFLFFPFTASAESGFSISPAILEINKEDSYTILLANRDSKQMNLRYRFVNLQPSSSGSLTKMSIIDTPEYFEIVGINESNGIEVNPRSSVEVTLTYTRTSATPQNLVGIEFVSTLNDPLENRTESTVQTSIVVPLLVLDNNGQSKIDVSNFETSTFISDNQAEFNIKLRNTGNSLVKTDATITIKNLLGRTIESIDLGSKYIFNGQTTALSINESNDIVWSPNILIGVYSADLEVKYNGQNTVKTLLFIGIPAKLTAIGVISLIFIVGIYLRVKKYL